MLYALDTEFIENGKTIDLLSIGIVAENGRTFYVQNLDCDIAKANPWVVENVYPHLVTCSTGTLNLHRHEMNSCCNPACPWLFHAQIGDAIEGFIGYDRTPKFITYYGAYDWVALCQCYGAMIDLPMYFPMYAIDLRTWLDNCGHSEITQADDMPHNALSDAQWIMTTWQQAHGIWGAGHAE